MYQAGSASLEHSCCTARLSPATQAVLAAAAGCTGANPYPDSPDQCTARQVLAKGIAGRLSATGSWLPFLPYNIAQRVTKVRAYPGSGPPQCTGHAIPHRPPCAHPCGGCTGLPQCRWCASPHPVCAHAAQHTCQSRVLCSHSGRCMWHDCLSCCLTSPSSRPNTTLRT